MSIDPAAIRTALEGARYPATKSDLTATARDNGAEDDVLTQLDRLPEGMTFSTPTEVSMRLKDLQSA